MTKKEEKDLAISVRDKIIKEYYKLNGKKLDHYKVKQLLRKLMEVKDTKSLYFLNNPSIIRCAIDYIASVNASRSPNKDLLRDYTFLATTDAIDIIFDFLKQCTDTNNQGVLAYNRTGFLMFLSEKDNLDNEYIMLIKKIIEEFSLDNKPLSKLRGKLDIFNLLLCLLALYCYYMSDIGYFRQCYTVLNDERVIEYLGINLPEVEVKNDFSSNPDKYEFVINFITEKVLELGPDDNLRSIYR